MKEPLKTVSFGQHREMIGNRGWLTPGTDAEGYNRDREIKPDHFLALALYRGKDCDDNAFIENRRTRITGDQRGDSQRGLVDHRR